MTEITDEGRKLAADLANAVSRERNGHNQYTPDNLMQYDAGKALARLATQSIARDARIAMLEAELAEAKADLRAIDKIAQRHNWKSASSADTAQEVAAIAAKHRETDPLADALRSLPAEFAHCVDGADRLRAELAKRGIELKGVGA